MIKRLIALLAALLLLLPLGSCTQKKQDGLTVVCTVFPLYDWARQIVGDAEGVEVILLAGNGTDLHSYQPTAEDIVRLRTCDLVVRLGGGADAWVEDALSKAPSEERRVLSLTELEGVTLREVSDRSAEGGHAHGTHEHHEDCVIDEHIWLSLQNASVCVAALTEEMISLDGEREALYAKNGAAYVASLTALDKAYETAIAHAVKPRMVVADRFPFLYLAEDYGIEYLAAFEGCSTESDADVETVIRLASALDEWELSYVVITESSDGRLAESVIRAGTDRDRRVAVLDSLQSATARELSEGKSYLGAMEQNLETLKQILSSVDS